MLSDGQKIQVEVKLNTTCAHRYTDGEYAECCEFEVLRPAECIVGADELEDIKVDGMPLAWLPEVDRDEVIWQLQIAIEKQRHS